MIRVVLFDVDNTLLSFSGYVKESMASGFRHFGLPPYEAGMFEVFERINNGLWRQLERGELTFGELIAVRWNRIFDALGIDFDGAAFEDYFRRQLFHSAVLEPGAKEILQPKYKLGIASNGPYDQQLNRLRVGGLDGFFSHFFVSGRVGASKPQAAFFDACMAELRADGMPELQPEEVMIIGDSLTSDISGGRNAGMRTCLYCPGGHAAEPCPADHAVSMLADIREIL